MGAEPRPAWPSVDDPDRTTRARIRDAAIARFAEQGVAATSVKSIADDVGVSPPLVIHHFGSKEGLRTACDEYVAGVIRDAKRAAMAAGTGLDPFQAIRDAQQGHLMKYLARTLVDSSPEVARLLDEMVDDAVGYMQVGIESGLLKPSDWARERAVVLLLWQLGALVLHEHAERLLGVDLTADGDALLPWALPAMEILAEGVIDTDFYRQWRDQAATHQEPRDT